MQRNANATRPVLRDAKKKKKNTSADAFLVWPGLYHVAFDLCFFFWWTFAACSVAQALSLSCLCWFCNWINTAVFWCFSRDRKTARMSQPMLKGWITSSGVRLVCVLLFFLCCVCTLGIINPHRINHRITQDMLIHWHMQKNRTCFDVFCMWYYTCQRKSPGLHSTQWMHWLD